VAFFLFSEGEEDLLRGQAEIQIAGGRIVTMSAQYKVNVLKWKRGGVVAVGRMDMLTRTKEEEEANNTTVAGAPQYGAVRPICIRNSRGSNKGHWNGLDPACQDGHRLLAVFPSGGQICH
jgi:hypothetical protein